MPDDRPESLSRLFASRTLTLDDLYTPSPLMRSVVERARTAAAHDIEVLLAGETGTGKNLLAFGIHNSSPRREGPFIWVNSAAISENLVESELFGHEKGAFTGALSERRGFLELAHGGTLFFDEIGNMPLYLQGKLLTALEHGRFYRLGGTTEISVDLRLVTATNCDVRQAIRSGKLREDLYYRLARIVIQVPPLRERREDILFLARRFIAEDNARFTRAVEGLTSACEARLLSYSWPGNARQLRGAISNAICMSRGPVLDVADVFSANSAFSADDRAAAGTVLSQSREVTPEGVPSLGRECALSLEEIERMHIERVLRANVGNIKRSAETLKISRQALYAKLKEYGIGVPGRSIP